MGFWKKLFGLEPALEIEAADNYQYPTGQYDGQKFSGGVSGMIDEISGLDYWTLRERSARLFNFNSYAKGIVRRLVTNVINTGLSVESTPEEAVLGVPEDSLSDWSEMIENRFNLWAQSPQICDVKGYRTFGGVQAAIYREAIIEGDCLVIARQDTRTKLPQLQAVNGSRVQTPPEQHANPRVVDGVHLDVNGRHLGYWVYKGTEDVEDDRYVYVSARGRKTGRLQAWLVYGFDKREDGVRGEPLLAVAIQPLNEIDRYRDSAQRKAYINSMIVGFIKRSDKGPGSLPIQGAAVRKKTTTKDEETANPVTVAEILPGVYMERLQPGEEPAPYSINGADVNFGAFEASILVGIAWALEIPPEILMLSFNKNYSASQAAVNEFWMLLARERKRFGDENNAHVYEDWFLSELLLGKIRAPGFLEAMRNPIQYDVVRSWLLSEWIGPVKPATDLLKQANGFAALVNGGWTTNAKAARLLTGSKFSKNMRILKRENELKMEAQKPLMEAEAEFGQEAVARALARITPQPLGRDDGHEMVDDDTRN